MEHLGKLTSTLKCLSAKLEFAQLSSFSPGGTPDLGASRTPLTPMSDCDGSPPIGSPMSKQPDFSEILDETEKFEERMSR
eukprot:1188997-Prorocentrum_minimum.AAC.1